MWLGSDFLLPALKQTLIYLESSKSCRKVLLVTRKQISPPNTPSCSGRPISTTTEWARALSFAVACPGTERRSTHFHGMQSCPCNVPPPPTSACKWGYPHVPLICYEKLSIWMLAVRPKTFSLWFVQYTLSFMN